MSWPPGWMKTRSNPEPVQEGPSREAAFVRHARAALSLRFRCSRTHQYAPLRFSLRLASGAFLNGLNRP